MRGLCYVGTDGFPPHPLLSMLKDFISFLGHQSRWLLVIAGLVALLLIGIGDWFATGSLLEFSVFFVLPVSYSAWFLGRRTGLLASMISAATIMAISLNSPLHAINRRVVFWNGLIWLAFFSLMTFLIADLKALHMLERELARVDDLTRVATRVALYEFAGIEINRLRRSSSPITLVYVDLDSFKEVNDRQGHAMGDKVLVTVAQIMRKGVRDTDLVARMGGDEFALMLPNTSKDAAQKVLEKVLASLTRSMRQHRWPVTFSAGAVTFVSPPKNIQEMIKRADEVMYTVKQSGKNHLRQEEVAA
jgi:diguanylate cyclase (GGDEF)-like protein